MRTGWRRALRAPALLVALGIAPGCSVTGGRAQAPDGTSTSTTTPSIVAACDALYEPVTLSSEVDGPVVGRTVVETALGTAASAQRQVVIYLDPEADEEALHALAGEVDSRPGVRSTAERGRDATYEDFQRLFADQEEMLANVQPEDLPLSVTAVVDSADAAALVTWARAESLVYDVSEFDAVRSSTDLTRWLEREADRDELARFAALLHHVDGQPSWATVAADILDDARADGVGQVDADPQQVAEATAELARQVARC